MCDDGDLLTLTRGGDAVAFETLYERYKLSIYRTALGVTGEPALADEVLQDTFWRCYQAALQDRLDASRPLIFWLQRVAINLCYDNLRQRRWKVLVSLESLLDTAPAGEASDPEAVVQYREARTIVHQIIARLPAVHRAVVALYYFHEYSLEEIAQILDCPVGTVKSRLRYARERLRSALAPDKPLRPALPPVWVGRS